MIWVRSLIQMTALAGFCLLSAPHLAAAQDEVHLSYEVSLAGLTIATAALDLIIADSSYVARMKYRMSGAARLMSSGTGEAVANGAYKAGRFIPAHFDLDHRAGRRSQKVAMAIVDGTIRTLALDPPIDPNSGRTPFDLDKLGSIIDPVSAMLISAVAPDGKPEPRVCDRTLAVFDGIRRYDLTLSLQGSDFSNQGIWSGPRTSCRLRLTQIPAETKPETRPAEPGARLGSVDVTFGLAKAAKVYVPVAIAAVLGRATLAVRLTQFSTGEAHPGAAQ